MIDKLSNLFTFRGASVTTTELPELFPMQLTLDEFVKSDCFTIYDKILKDTIERTYGIKDDINKYLFDNCLGSENNFGLISMLSYSMLNKSDLYIVFDKSIDLLREANQQEKSEIKFDYEKQNKSSIGFYISFKNLKKTDFIKLYSSLEYILITGLNKNVNLSKAIQIKMSEMRAGVSLSDSETVISQAVAIAEALSKGKDVLLDGKDSIEMLSPDLNATEKGLQFINQKRSFYLGLPASYISGVLNSGLGDSGNADAKAIDRGLKYYYFSIIKPVFETIFGIKTSYKDQDYTQISTGLEALKTFELVDDSLVDVENKKMIINKLFDIREN